MFLMGCVGHLAPDFTQVVSTSISAAVSFPLGGIFVSPVPNNLEQTTLIRHHQVDDGAAFTSFDQLFAGIEPKTRLLFVMTVA